MIPGNVRGMIRRRNAQRSAELAQRANAKRRPGRLAAALDALDAILAGGAWSRPFDTDADFFAAREVAFDARRELELKSAALAAVLDAFDLDDLSLFTPEQRSALAMARKAAP